MTLDDHLRRWVGDVGIPADSNLAAERRRRKLAVHRYRRPPIRRKAIPPETLAAATKALAQVRIAATIASLQQRGVVVTAEAIAQEIGEDYGAIASIDGIDRAMAEMIGDGQDS